MYLPSQGQPLDARQDKSDDEKSSGKNNTDNKNAFVIAAAVIVFSLGIILMSYFALRTLRRMNYGPKYIPGKFLKDRWNRWAVGPSYGQIPNGASSSNRNANGSATTGQTSTEEGSEMNTANGVRRDTSVRSVITLPPYSVSPKPTEQVIAREGERGGMDVVVEFPETAEEEESRREDLMESLYQIRQQRREEIAEREERRRERREARARGDYVRLEQLRIQSRARAQSRSSANGSNTNLSAALTVAEHQSRGRERRISSVSYAEVGYVRHDGSRLRADSPDSDRSPLLSNAAAVATEHPNRSSTSVLMNVHSRGESYSSVQSAATGISDTDTLTHVDSHPQSTHSAHHSVTEPEEGDVGVHVIPPPPEYDNLDWGDAPPYESPVADRGENVPRLRELTVLPSIQIEAATPVGNTPTTPTNPHDSDRDFSAETSSDTHENPSTTTTPPANNANITSSSTTTGPS